MEVTYSIANYRMEQCLHCPSPCEHQFDKVWRNEGDNQCPSNRFMAYRLFKKSESKPKRFRGAGDVVALVAQPIAGAIDKVFKTKIKRCGGCAKRQELLNNLIPF